MNICPKCGAEVEGMFCPECGAKIEAAVPESNQTDDVVEVNQTTKVDTPEVPFSKSTSQESNTIVDTNKKGKGFAIASLIFGIIALCTVGVFVIPEILGIVFAFVSKKGNPMRGIAIAGLVCSILSIFIFIVLLFI